MSSQTNLDWKISPQSPPQRILIVEKDIEFEWRSPDTIKTYSPAIQHKEHQKSADNEILRMLPTSTYQ
ncbi:hypothetical protein [Brasilonema sp. UFV-L1]|uniref:hypothetical protein n=1 Tax=Brasilonema sp. UFV-L1 TaxID=2234130 RepID=UPI00145F9DDB|nr:hypothetical protein [Brasilonema sp. UFV-L1]